MSTLRFKRFSKAHILKEIDRSLLGKFFARFKKDLDEEKVTLPSPELEDEVYFNSLAGILLSPEGLPDSLNDALYAIDEMATEDGQQRLEDGVAKDHPELTFDEKSSHAEIGLQVWLNAPELLARKHNEQKLIRLSSFEYYSNPTPTDRSKTFKNPDAETLKALADACDQWFSQHNRGHKTTKIETYELDGEFWFVIRHGDTYARTSKIEEQKSSIIHYRPEKDDVVVYAPDLDEIRIHAATPGEKKLYREKFGFYLFDREDYFSNFKTYTLEPLRLGKDCLDTASVLGIKAIILREVEMGWPGGFNDGLVRKSDDVFASAATRKQPSNLISENAKLNRASFDIYFEGSEKPRKVQIRLPNILKIGRHCDAHLVHRWLSKQKFRISAKAAD